MVVGGNCLMIKSRDDLKSSFRSGAIPTATDFANLIDSLAHVDEVAPVKQQLDEIGARTDAIEQKVQMSAALAVVADGSWQVLKSSVDTLCAFEILAQIDKTKTSPFAALTHAVAVSGATRSRPSVRQTKSYSQGAWPWILVALIIISVDLFIYLLLASRGWIDEAAIWADVGPIKSNLHNIHIIAGILFVLALIGIAVALRLRDRRAITVAWRSSGKLFDPHRSFDLVIRSGCNYGSKTQKVQMDCQIKRLWN